MAANILVREFKVPVSDRVSIDISVHVQVRKVFGRLGLIRPNASLEKIIYRARELNPLYPGISDLSAWEVGRQYCHTREPDCTSCYMNRLCPVGRTRLGGN